MAGTAAICPEFRFILRGLEHADSFCFNPHKWMFTNFDCDCFFVADRGEYTACLAIDPAYLQDRKDRSDLTIDYRNWQIPLGRRFRALKLWFVIRHYGVEGLQDHVRRHVEIAQRFAEWVRSDPDFEVLAPHPLNLVCFAHRRGDEYSRRILERVNEEGRMFVSHAELKGRYAIRMSIGQTHTEERHVRGAWDRIHEAAATLMTALVLLVSLAACSTTGVAGPETGALGRETGAGGPEKGAFAPETVAPGQTADGPLLVLLVRHAERATDPPGDPVLSDAGERRARDLARRLAETHIDHIITSHLSRTVLTAAVIARERNLEPERVPVTSGIEAHVQDVVRAVRARAPGEAVLVVGHSNTIPAIVHALGGPELGDLEDADYSNLFIMQIDGSGSARTVLASFD
jgi:broad specificity phosphatase PhoE